jgi:hypothetical protein
MDQRACSDTLFHVLNNCAFASPLTTEEKAANALAGGILHYRYQCGMIWGAALAAGAQAWRLMGSGPRAEASAIQAARRLVDSFRELNQQVDCADLTGLEPSANALQLTTYFLLKGGTLGCFRMAANYAPVAFSEINAALGAEEPDLPAPPLSCAALLAQKLGVSEMHVVMAAGLAGGIGLSGGGCGALGAAVWIKGMQRPEQGGRLDQKGPEARLLIERFLAATGGRFECAAITGRRFESLAEHAAWLREDGCARVIDALAES